MGLLRAGSVRLLYYGGCFFNCMGDKMKRIHWCVVLLAVGFAATGQAVDYFTQQFGNGDNIDLLNKSITFTPDGSANYYSANVADITELPTPYATHQLRAVGDDTYREVSFVDGKTFEFYGVSYTNVFIGSNGYLTFGAGDTSLSSSTYTHFLWPRISGLMSDLNPPLGGGLVYGQQLSDSFVVTYENVPQYNGYNWFTFQIEIFFDGRIRISWSRVDDVTRVCVVGLSSGTGQRSDFVETDLSSLVRDFDEDGMLDVWENTYFGHYSNCTASADFDGDGFDNMSEFICGSHPKDKDSYFKVDFNLAAAGTVVSWNSVDGRRYRILKSSSLTLGTFSEVGAVDYPVGSYTNTPGAIGFYQVDVELMQ